MPEEKLSIKKFIKVWSQAGATFVAALVAFAVMRSWIDWSADVVAQFMLLYGAAMMVLRQLFSVTEDAEYAGDINIQQNEDGVKVFTLDLNGDPENLENLNKVTFKINPTK